MLNSPKFLPCVRERSRRWAKLCFFISEANDIPCENEDTFSVKRMRRTFFVLICDIFYSKQQLVKNIENPIRTQVTIPLYVMQPNVDYMWRNRPT